MVSTYSSECSSKKRIRFLSYPIIGCDEFVLWLIDMMNCFSEVPHTKTINFK